MRGYSKEEGLKLLAENLKVFKGKIPTLREYNSKNLSPTYGWFARKFGNFDNALGLIGINILSKTKIMNMIKEDLIQILKDKYEELGKSPTSKEIKNPSITVYYERFKTQSWNEVLKEAGLPINHEELNKEEVMNNFRRLYYKLNRVPTREEIQKDTETPDVDYIYDRGYTINSFYHKLGLVKLNLTDKEKISISINELISLANKLNRCPSVEEYEQVKHNGYTRRRLEYKLNKNYNDLCKEYIPEFDVHLEKNVDKEKVIDSIHRMYNEIGYILPYSEYKKLTYSYSYTVIKNRFNQTYGQLAESLGYEPFGTTTLRKTDDELIDDFIALFKKLKRLPYVYEFINENNIQSYSTYKNRFNNYEKLCRISGIDYKIYKNNRILYDKQGNVCRSSPELIISNYFIDNNMLLGKETYYKKIISNIEDNRRFDWTIQDKNGKKYYVEYFGLFQRNPKTNLTKHYLKKTHKKIRDLYKAGIINQCIFIFPSDIKYNVNDSLENKLKAFFMSKNIFI